MSATAQRFIATERASVGIGETELIWPHHGSPAAFDPAAQAMYGCFAEPLTIDEFTEDLKAALDFAPGRAATTAFTFVSGLVRTGHLADVDAGPAHEAYRSYPPSASP